MLTEEIETATSIPGTENLKKSLDPSIILAKLHVAAVEKAGKTVKKLSSKGNFGNTIFDGKGVYIATRNTKEFVYIKDTAKLFKLSESTIRNSFREYIRAFAGFGGSESISDDDLKVYKIQTTDNSKFYICPYIWNKPSSNSPDNPIRQQLFSAKEQPANRNTKHQEQDDDQKQQNDQKPQEDNKDTSSTSNSNSSSSSQTVKGKHGNYVVASQNPMTMRNNNTILSETDLTIDLKELFLEKISEIEKNKK